MAAADMESDVSWEELIQLETEFDDVDSQISTSRLFNILPPFDGC
jgi:hypothetical protein